MLVGVDTPHGTITTSTNDDDQIDSKSLYQHTACRIVVSYALAHANMYDSLVTGNIITTS